MCPKASIRQETEKSREKEPTKARRFELSKIPSHVLKPTATRQFEGSSERRIGEREKRRQSGSETRRRLPSHSPQRRRAVKPAGSRGSRGVTLEIRWRRPAPGIILSIIEGRPLWGQCLRQPRSERPDERLKCRATHAINRKKDAPSKDV